MAYANEPSLNLGSWCTLDNTVSGNVLHIPAQDFVTHGVIVGA